GSGCEWDRSSSLANFFGTGHRLGRDERNGFAHELAQIVAAVLDVVDDLATHASLPEIAQVIRDFLDRFAAIRIAGEVGADVVGHHDEVLNVGRLTVFRVRAPVAPVAAVRLYRFSFGRDLDGGNLELGTIRRPVGMFGHQIVGARFGMMKRSVHDAGLHSLSHQRSQTRLAAARPHLEPIAVADAAQLGVARMYLEAILRMHRGIQRAPRLSTNIVLTEYSASSQYQRELAI